MRPARIIAAIVLAAALAVTGWAAYSSADRSSAAAQPPGAASPREPSASAKPQPGAGPDTPPRTTSPRRDRRETGRCDTSALQGSAETRFGTCASVGVQALQASPPTPPVDRIADPQVAADRLVAAWLRGDRAAADKLTTSPAVTERLFSEPPPSKRPAVLPCRLVDLGLYLCSYRLAPPNELNIWVTGGASVGYGISNVELVD
jgi:predicted lipid-binding transport protein (Tim44 family)